MSREAHAFYCFAVVVCQHPTTGLWLAVKERHTSPRGEPLWWLPAGRVEPGETFPQAALRETKEEAGLDVDLTGILRVEHSVVGASTPSRSYHRMRVVYTATPKDPSAAPKSVPDKESLGAAWMSVQELLDLKRKGLLRGSELLSWAGFLNTGGKVHPLDIMDEESEGPPFLWGAGAPSSPADGAGPASVGESGEAGAGAGAGEGTGSAAGADSASGAGKGATPGDSTDG
jgi:8-oxo-dGTP pyrophosphatase MutT (NUDIX family)